MTVIYQRVSRREIREGVFSLSLSGEFDLFTAPELGRDLADLLDRGARTIVVDLTDTSFTDSTTLGVLLGARNELVARGGRMVLATDSRLIRSVLEQTGLRERFELVAAAPDVSGGALLQAA